MLVERYHSFSLAMCHEPGGDDSTARYHGAGLGAPHLERRQSLWSSNGSPVMFAIYFWPVHFYFLYLLSTPCGRIYDCTSYDCTSSSAATEVRKGRR